MSSPSSPDPPAGELLTFSLKPDLTPTERTRFFRRLYGYVRRSTCGRYRYDRPGVLSEIPHVRFARAAVIVGFQDKAKLMRFLRPWARVTRRTVLLTSSDQRKLFPDAPGP